MQFHVLHTHSHTSIQIKIHWYDNTLIAEMTSFPVGMCKSFHSNIAIDARVNLNKVQIPYQSTNDVTYTFRMEGVNWRFEHFMCTVHTHTHTLYSKWQKPICEKCIVILLLDKYTLISPYKNKSMCTKFGKCLFVCCFFFIQKKLFCSLGI